MEHGLGELGFWLAAGIVVAAMIVAGAIKERDRQAAARESQAVARESQEKRQATLAALLEKGGGHVPEVLAYLRERDAAAAARADAGWRRMEASKRQNDRRGQAFVGALMVGFFCLICGMVVAETLRRPALPRPPFTFQAGHLVPTPPPPPPTALETWLPVGLMLAVWAAGLVLALTIAIRGGAGKQHDAQPDA